MSSALKIARRYKDINSVGLHFEQTHTLYFSGSENRMQL